MISHTQVLPRAESAAGLTTVLKEQSSAKHTHTHTGSQTRAQTHTHTPTHTHTHTHQHTHTHRSTHTHTHTRTVYPCCCFPSGKCSGLQSAALFLERDHRSDL